MTDRDTEQRRDSGYRSENELGGLTLRNINRLLRPFNVLFSVFIPDDAEGYIRISLIKGKYPLVPWRVK